MTWAMELLTSEQQRLSSAEPCWNHDGTTTPDGDGRSLGLPSSCYLATRYSTT